MGGFYFWRNALSERDLVVEKSDESKEAVTGTWSSKVGTKVTSPKRVDGNSPKRDCSVSSAGYEKEFPPLGMLLVLELVCLGGKEC